VSGEDQDSEEVGIDVGQRLVGDLDAQGAPDYRRSLALRSNLGKAPWCSGGLDERLRCRRRSSSTPPGPPSGRWAAVSRPSMPPTWAVPRSRRLSTAPR